VDQCMNFFFFFFEKITNKARERRIRFSCQRSRCYHVTKFCQGSPLHACRH